MAETMTKTVQRVFLGDGRWFDPAKARRWEANGEELFLTEVSATWALVPDDGEDAREIEGEEAVRWLVTTGHERDVAKLYQLAGDEALVDGVLAELEV